MTWYNAVFMKHANQSYVSHEQFLIISIELHHNFVPSNQNVFPLIVCLCVQLMPCQHG